MNKGIKTILTIICAASIAGSAMAKAPTVADLLSQLIALHQQLLQLLIQQQNQSKPLLYGAPDNATTTDQNSSFFKFDSASMNVTSGKGRYSDQADFKISFKVGLQGKDMYINNVNAVNPGIIVKTSNDQIISVSCSSPDSAYYDYTNKFFVIYSGQTKTITCSGHIDPQTSGQYYAYISDLKWSYSYKDIPDFSVTRNGFEPMLFLETDTVYLTKIN